MARSVSARQGGSPGKALIFFGLIFAAFGSIFVWIFLLQPLLFVQQVQHWVSIPCVITHSEVISSHDNDDGTTYRVDVRYTYRYRPGVVEAGPDDPEYEGYQFDAWGDISTSGSAEKYRIISELPVGTRSTCLVNPDNPAESVLRGGLPDGMWVGLFTLIFPGAGFAIMFAGVVSLRRSKNPRAQGNPRKAYGATRAPTDGDEPVQVLRPSTSRTGKVIGIGVFALFWNGITWTIFLTAWSDGEIFVLLFMSIFVLIGLGALAAWFHALLALRNPRIQVELLAQHLHPGDSAELRWHCEGNAHKFTSFSIKLCGIESATYRRGTSTSTDTHVFHEATLCEQTDFVDIQDGSVRLQLPTQAVPTFKSNNNRLYWELRVVGEIPRWPDVSDTYELSVVPRRQP